MRTGKLEEHEKVGTKTKKTFAWKANLIADENLGHAIGGAVWHGVKGFRNSPYGERRIGALTAIKARAPVLGGNFGVWGGLFSTFDCAVKGIRKKEDPYNAIIAGFFTGGALAIRGGAKAARNSAIGCACLLAVIEGVGIGFQRMMAENTRLDIPQPPAPPPSETGGTGFPALAH
ncbi:hypothetical protein G7Y89_g11631 [Cudoniella acicularis]|uniref:Mitochondrial import inner membrane translocase subunit TIM17 n=1 Tax=Cudoniella acicularis TaxID=354080 RepID=A0A8H4RD44_9HELO|nr:hypothetical protein G7Y89_g11631 [Cudoniella acicularis]